MNEDDDECNSSLHPQTSDSLKSKNDDRSSPITIIEKDNDKENIWLSLPHKIDQDLALILSGASDEHIPDKLDEVSMLKACIKAIEIQNQMLVAKLKVAEKAKEKVSEISDSIKSHMSVPKKAEDTQQEFVEILQQELAEIPHQEFVEIPQQDDMQEQEYTKISPTNVCKKHRQYTLGLGPGCKFCAQGKCNFKTVRFTLQKTLQDGRLIWEPDNCFYGKNCNNPKCQFRHPDDPHFCGRILEFEGQLMRCANVCVNGKWVCKICSRFEKKKRG